MSKFLMNTWYLAAWSEEVTRDLLARTLLDIPMVFFRTENGEPVALVDMCPHRFAPLSMGRLRGDVVACGYHGLEFNTHGECIRNPLGALPKAAKVKSFLLAETEGQIWIWPGDPERADRNAIPTIPYLHDEVNFKTQVHGLMPTAANYGLVMDNLMDLGHVEFLHPQFSGVLATGKHTVRQDGTVIHSDWLTHNAVNNPLFFELLFPMHGKPFDHWLEMSWQAPSFMYLSAGITPAGRSRDEGYDNVSVHILTPETEFTTHYFWHTAQSVKSHLAAKDFKARIEHVFNTEDKPMVQAIQKRMGARDFWSLEPVLLQADAGAVRVRRVLQQMISEENAQATH